MKKAILIPLNDFGVKAVLLIIIAILVYWGLGFGLAEDGGFGWDEPIMQALYALRQPWLNSFFTLATYSVMYLAVIPVLAVLVYLWRRDERITAVLYLAAVIAFPLISVVVKNEFARPRQQIIPPLVVESTYSFPSGHTLAAVAIYGFAAVLLWQRGHRGLAVLSAMWVFVVGLSRIYLGAHYPSDVLASLAVGTILLIIFVFIDRQLNEQKNKQAKDD